MRSSCVFRIVLGTIIKDEIIYFNTNRYYFLIRKMQPHSKGVFKIKYLINLDVDMEQMLSKWELLADLF